MTWSSDLFLIIRPLPNFNRIIVVVRVRIVVYVEIGPLVLFRVFYLLLTCKTIVEVLFKVRIFELTLMDFNHLIVYGSLG
jgi:hypothetical protein